MSQEALRPVSRRLGLEVSVCVIWGKDMKPAHILVEGYFTQEEQISQFMLFMLSKHGQMQETGFIEKSPENIQGCEGRFASFLRVQSTILTFFHDFLSEWIAGQ